MADPAEVGRKLATQVRSQKEVITPGLVEALAVFMTHLFPDRMGKFLRSRTARAKDSADSSMPFDP